MKRGSSTIFYILALLVFSATAFAATANTTSHVFILNSNPYVVQILMTPNPAEVGIDTMTVRANVTDNNGVPADIFTVNATYDFGTPGTPGDDVIVWLVFNATSGLYENDTYSIPNTGTLGTWNVTVTAEDNFNGIGTNSTTFTVQDMVYPSVTDIQPPAGTVYNTTDIVLIAANVTDNGVVDTVNVNVSWDSTNQIITLVYNATSGLYEYYWTNTTMVDQYNVTFFANDTANNLNNTETTYFNTTDGTAPVIYYISDSPDPVDPGNMINFTANVSDNGAIDTVTIEIDGANYTMVFLSGEEYYFDTFDTYIAPGLYNYTVYANDTASNDATPMTGNFTVNTLISVALLNTPIDFGNTTVPITDRRADDGTTGSGYIGGTIKGFPLIINNTGNVNENMSIMGTDLVGQTNATYVVGIGNMTYNMTSTLPGIPMTTSDTLFNANQAMSTTQNIYFWISLPGGLISQDYNGNVTVTAIQS